MLQTSAIFSVSVLMNIKFSSVPFRPNPECDDIMDEIHEWKPDFL